MRFCWLFRTNLKELITENNNTTSVLKSLISDLEKDLTFIFKDSDSDRKIIKRVSKNEKELEMKINELNQKLITKE